MGWLVTSVLPWLTALTIMTVAVPFPLGMHPESRGALAALATSVLLFCAAVETLDPYVATLAVLRWWALMVRTEIRGG